MTTIKLTVSAHRNRVNALLCATEFERWGERKPGIAGSGVVRLSDGFTASVWRTRAGTIVVREIEPGRAPC